MTAVTDFFTAEQFQQLEENAQSDSRYVKINKLKSDVEHRYRYFGTAITGFEGWVENEQGKPAPIRFELRPEELPENLKPDMNGKKDLKFFMAGIVWDYQEESFKILSITQKTLLDKVKKYAMDDDYGNPTGYDIKVTRSEKDGRTTYDLIAAPPKPALKSIGAAFEDLYCDLSRLYDGEDPFEEPKA
jgi:hypothetical protein